VPSAILGSRESERRRCKEFQDLPPNLVKCYKSFTIVFVFVTAHKTANGIKIHCKWGSRPGQEQRNELKERGNKALSASN
jgi:hypothetical protein